MTILRIGNSADLRADGVAAISQEERATLQLIDERDAAEECLSQIYYLVTGNSPQWSNKFGHAEALQDVADAVAVLKQSINT